MFVSAIKTNIDSSNIKLPKKNFDVAKIISKEKVLDDRFETNFVVNEIEPWAEDTSSSQD